MSQRALKTEKRKRERTRGREAHLEVEVQDVAPVEEREALDDVAEQRHDVLDSKEVNRPLAPLPPSAPRPLSPALLARRRRRALPRVDEALQAPAVGELHEDVEGRDGRREGAARRRRLEPGVVVPGDVGVRGRLEEVHLAEDRQERRCRVADGYCEREKASGRCRKLKGARRSTGQRRKRKRDALFLHAYRPSASPLSTCRTRYTLPCPPLPVSGPSVSDPPCARGAARARGRETHRAAAAPRRTS